MEEKDRKVLEAEDIREVNGGGGTVSITRGGPPPKILPVPEARPQVGSGEGSGGVPWCVSSSDMDGEENN